MLDGSYSWIVFDDCANYGDVAGEYAGGLYGYLGATTDSDYEKREKATEIRFANCASYGVVSAETLGGACFGFCADTKASKVVRSLGNSFFLIPTSGQLATIGGGIEFALTGVVRSDDADYLPKSAALALSQSAGDGHGLWGAGRLADASRSVVPELLAFRTTEWRPSFAIIVR